MSAVVSGLPMSAAVMATVLACLGAAVLVAPGVPGAARLRALRPEPGARPRSWRATSALGSAAVAGGTVAVVFGPTQGVAAAVAAATGHRLLGARRAARRRDRDAGVLADAVSVVVAELRTGAHPGAACAVAAGETEGPVRAVLSEAAARARLGGSAADGLRSGEPGLDDELARVAAAWRVAEQRGVALGELLDAVRLDLVGRARFRRRTEAGLAGARATAAVLAGLPLLGILMGQAVGAAPVPLLLTTRTGGGLLLLGTLLVCAGLMWSDRITARVGAA